MASVARKPTLIGSLKQDTNPSVLRTTNNLSEVFQWGNMRNCKDTLKDKKIFQVASWIVWDALEEMEKMSLKRHVK